MKVSSAKITGFVASPPAKIQAFLLFGSDVGLISTHAKTLARQIVPNKEDDAFNNVRISPEDLKEEPSLVTDELSAISLMGGRRVVNCIDFTERDRDAIEAALQVLEKGDSRLIVTSKTLKSSSKLCKLFEGNDVCAALGCYSDDERSLTEVIRQTLRVEKMEADRDALTLLHASLGADRALSLRELEKLILYKGEPGPITYDDVSAVIADAAPLGIDDYLYSITGGNSSGAETALQRLLDDGQAPIRLHNALTQHLARFSQVLGEGNDISKAANALKPPLFWKAKTKFIAQANRMRSNRLLEALRTAHRGGVDLRLSAYPPGLVLSRLTLNITRLFR